jgi:hypothetical protein
VSSEAGNFISKSFGWDFSDFREDSFVDVEVVGKFLIVLFEKDLSGSLDGFSSDSAH